LHLSVLAARGEDGYKRKGLGKDGKMSRTYKILVVDDDEGVRELLRTLFDEEGYEIAMAGSGSEMRAALAAGSVNLAVIDVTLPRGEDGLRLADEARAAGCGVILVSGDTGRFAAVEQCGHPYLLKPFRMERLLALVTEVLGGQSGRAPAPGQPG
jgi:two-component system OmpR family response regulator